MKNFFILIFAIFFVNLSFSQVEKKIDSTKTKIFNELSDPQKDLSNAIKIAKKSNKNILLDVGGDWCPWCRKLDKLFHENEEIASLLEKHFIVLKVNYSKANKNEKFLSKFPKIEGYPHLFVLDKKRKTYSFPKYWRFRIR